ncbi:MAG: LuxR family transcriptional regulator [Firmicutes bacterium HGW-Firmicutes-7]|nr:MAG: LuxR family transcriptional regulator [Firmicutes bacterium HGW-Firmicutes-7]
MDKQRRKELIEEYKQIKIYMGIFQVKNTVSGKIFVATSTNLKNKWFTLRLQLDMGRFANSELQKDWLKLGEEAFTYEVIEDKEVKEDTDKNWELKQMEKVWLEKLQPYENRGYNYPPAH